MSAATVLTLSVELDPSSVELHVELAELCEGMGRDTDAAGYYEAASRLYEEAGDPRAQPLLDRARRVAARS
jgi:hypothetical protein